MTETRTYHPNPPATADHPIKAPSVRSEAKREKFVRAPGPICPITWRYTDWAAI